MQLTLADLSIVLTVLYYLLYAIIWPIWKLLQSLLVIARPLLYVLQFLSLPFVYFAAFVGEGFAIPFRFLAKFESLYIYLGVAGVIGLVAGSILHFSYAFLAGALNLHSINDETPQGRTIAEYRAARRKKLDGPLYSPISSSPLYSKVSSQVSSLKPDLAKRNRQGTLTQTILEEDDSDS
ncbi:hypothetical protein LTS18_005653 [Coniosporium uncinatum]|uniref:Uncharacterized protein n=1 Tax=Coniosporium uncinatum TaxID=93489 RepID=A0ACC3DQX3_9PEZI|nr:hypothetical protein LTS18_005653 [Coniosporium uncinatum]